MLSPYHISDRASMLVVVIGGYDVFRGEYPRPH